jgi:hypothetical protein
VQRVDEAVFNYYHYIYTNWRMKWAQNRSLAPLYMHPPPNQGRTLRNGRKVYSNDVKEAKFYNRLFDY